MDGKRSVRMTLGSLGIAMGALSAPLAAADPAVPTDPVAPVAAGPEAFPERAVADSSATVVSAGVPHLPSPENLPPGTTQLAPERRTLGYLRDVWQAVRTEDVTMGDALLLLAQRPMSSVESGTSPQRSQRVPAPPDTSPAEPEAAVLPEPVS